jgi:hypothetical protein
MKTSKIKLVIAFTFLPLFLISQNNRFFDFKFGILGGSSYYIVDTDDLITLNNSNNTPSYAINVDNANLGIHFGIFTSVRVGLLILRPEIIFNSNVINYKVQDLMVSSPETIAKERYQFLDIPLLVGLKSGAFRAVAGPVGHLFLSNRSDLLEIVNFTSDFKRFTLGYQAGIALDIFNFMIDLRYEGNFTKYGEGIIFNGKNIYFSNNTGRIVASISFAIK